MLQYRRAWFGKILMKVSKIRYPRYITTVSIETDKILILAKYLR